jgi:hypothetical protein
MIFRRETVRLNPSFDFGFAHDFSVYYVTLGLAPVRHGPFASAVDAIRMSFRAFAARTDKAVKYQLGIVRPQIIERARFHVFEESTIELVLSVPVWQVFSVEES